MAATGVLDQKCLLDEKFVEKYSDYHTWDIFNLQKTGILKETKQKEIVYCPQ